MTIAETKLLAFLAFLVIMAVGCIGAYIAAVCANGMCDAISNRRRQNYPSLRLGQVIYDWTFDRERRAEDLRLERAKQYREVQMTKRLDDNA